MRTLSPEEEAFCRVHGLRAESFAGERLDTFELVRRDAYSIASSGGAFFGAADGTVDALGLTHNLRFGNMMVALSNAWHVAGAIGVSKIYLQPSGLLPSKFVVGGGVEFHQNEPYRGTVLKGQFFYSHTFGAQLRGSDKWTFWDRLGEVLVPHLQAQIASRNPWLGSWLYKKICGDGRALTIHLRSGDIFSGDNPHPLYAQPPLSFYLAVVDECKPRRVKLIFEDFGNPVISALLHELKSRKIIVSVIDGPIEEALLEIYRSTNFVAAKGSFSSPMLAMSPHVRRIYSWGASPHRRLGENWKREVSVIEAHGSGYRELVTPWRNSQVQRTAMLEWRPDSIALTRVGAER